MWISLCAIGKYGRYQSLISYLCKILNRLVKFSCYWIKEHHWPLEDRPVNFNELFSVIWIKIILLTSVIEVPQLIALSRAAFTYHVIIALQCKNQVIYFLRAIISKLLTCLHKQSAATPHNNVSLTQMFIKRNQEIQYLQNSTHSLPSKIFTFAVSFSIF